MSEPTSEPGPHPLVGRQRVLVVFLRAMTYLAVGLSVAGVVLPGSSGRVAAVALVVVLVGTPVVRVAWLLARWTRRGDRRFAAVAAALLAIMAVGAVSGL